MKMVNIAVPVWDEDLQRSRMPIENPLTVPDERAEAWKAEGLLAGDPEDAPGHDDKPRKGKTA